jgi:hypothetical protein
MRKRGYNELAAVETPGNLFNSKKDIMNDGSYSQEQGPPLPGGNNVR